MSKIAAALLACTAAFSGVSASVLPQLDTRADTTTSSNFSLFAFGSNLGTEIGGFPIFYNEGLAYIVNPAKVNHTTNYVIFTPNASDSTQWNASPYTESPDTLGWSGSTFYIPNGDGPVGFHKADVDNSTASDIITTGFKFYGTTAMVNVDSTLETLWFALATGIDGLWSVGWNASAGGIATAELLTLKKVTAPNVQYPARSDFSPYGTGHGQKNKAA